MNKIKQENRNRKMRRIGGEGGRKVKGENTEQEMKKEEAAERRTINNGEGERRGK
jgi:hypothetical protein